MTRWLDIAWAEEGVEEIPGAKHSDTVLGYFREAGCDDITNDETAWCSAFVATIVARAGIPVTVPKSDVLMARSWLKFGVELAEPRVGAIVVLHRGNPDIWQGHVGFVVAVKPDRISVLGGNQRNAVTVQDFPKSQVVGYRWPEAVTPKELEQRGSRIAKAAKLQKHDAAKAGGVQVIPDPTPAAAPIAASAPAPHASLPTDGLALPDQFPSPQDLMQHAQGVQTYTDAVASFLTFGAAKWPWIVFALSAYWLARMAWNSARIRQWRAEDASTGKTQ